MFRKWIVLICLLFNSIISISQTGSLDNDLTSIMQKYDAVGLSLVVVIDGGIVHSQSFGYKDLKDSVPLQNNDLFRIASISKSFVATAIMQLYERGKISLDDDVNNHLNFEVKNPKYPDIPITIRMLMCHRSSINDNNGYKTFDKLDPEINHNYSQCYNDYMPGSRYNYSNLNYNLLGAIVENLTDKRFDEFIYNNIVLPLGLNGGYNVLDLDSFLFAKAYSYNKSKGAFFQSKEAYNSYMPEISQYKLGYSTPVLSPAGGMKMSATGLANYMIMHMDGGQYNGNRIIETESELLMRQTPDSTQTYALSLYYSKGVIPGQKLLGHTGGSHGIHTAMFFHPEKRYGFVVLCNGYRSQDSQDVDFRYQIIRCLYNHFVKKEIKN